MRFKSYKHFLLILMVFILFSGSMPVVEAGSFDDSGVVAEGHLRSRAAEIPTETSDDKDNHKCTASIVCSHSCVYISAATVWQVAEWEPDWFSTAVKRLSGHIFGPEPTPPIS